MCLGKYDDDDDETAKPLTFLENDNFKSFSFFFYTFIVPNEDMI